MNILLFASAWGPKFGGVNALNRDLSIGLAQVLRGEGQVFCAVPNPQPEDESDAAAYGVILVPIRGKKISDRLDSSWAHDAWNWLGSQNVKTMNIWVGHDVISGDIAMNAARTFGGALGLIHHMSYIDYQGFKGKRGSEVDRLDREQRKLFSAKDAVLFAIGPLLTESCNQLANRRSTVELVPGFPELTSQDRTDNKLVAITYGRMDKASDPIKQGRLAAAAFGAAIDSARAGVPSSFMSAARMYVVGIEPDVYEEEDIFRALAEKHAKRQANVLALPFETDRLELMERLSGCNAAMMLSTHEGFGLTGWEAISAEVPLILSKNSGLYKLIEQRLQGEGLGCIHAIDVEGSIDRTSEENYSGNDLINVKAALLDIAGSIIAHRNNASTLKRKLTEAADCTWQSTAQQLLAGMGIEFRSLNSYIRSPQNTPQKLAVSSRSRRLGHDRFGWSNESISGQMVKARSTSNDFQHAPLIQSAKLMRIIMNDGITFFQRYEAALSTRARAMAHPKGDAWRTEICLLAPTGPHLEIVARRSEKTQAQQSANIESSARLLRKIFIGSRSGALDLFGMKDFFPYCLFQYDEMLLISVYPAFERLKDMPMLMLAPTGETSDMYYALLENTDRLFDRARGGQSKWFVSM